MESSLGVYTAAIRPSILYGCNAWYCPSDTPGHRKGVAAKLQAIQGRCLRTITGAYRATSTEALEIETFTAPLDLYAEQQVAKTTLRLHATHTRNEREKQIERLRRQLRGQRVRAAKPGNTPMCQKLKWTE